MLQILKVFHLYLSNEYLRWQHFVTHVHSTFVEQFIVTVLEGVLKETSMMWPSQNFLLYNGTVIKIQVNEWISN